MAELNRFRGMIAIMLILGAVSSALFAQQYRSELKTAPLPVGKEIIELAENGDWAAAKGKLAAIQPILDSIKTKFNVDLKQDIENAISVQNMVQVQTAVQKLVYFDMRDVMDAIIKEGSDKSNTALKGWHKIAYLDYLYLSSIVSSREITIDGKVEKGKLIDSRVRKLFRNAFLSLGKKSPYSRRESKADLARYQKYTDAIIAELEKVFPAFKPAAPAPAPEEGNG